MLVVDSQAIDRDATIPADVVQRLKDLGMFGLQIPEEYGMYCFACFMFATWTHLAVAVLTQLLNLKAYCIPPDGTR